MPYKDAVKAKANQRLRSKRYRERHKEKLLIKQRLYDKTPERKLKQNAARNARLQRMPDDARKDYHKKHNLKTLYKMSLTEFTKRLEAQSYRCAVCKQESNDWHVDHDHACCPGKRSCGECVRGILCGRCNVGLGAFNDNILSLEGAIQYLQGA